VDQIRRLRGVCVVLDLMFNPDNNGKNLIQLIPQVIRHLKPIMTGRIDDNMIPLRSGLRMQSCNAKHKLFSLVMTQSFALLDSLQKHHLLQAKRKENEEENRHTSLLIANMSNYWLLYSCRTLDCYTGLIICYSLAVD